MQYVPKGPKFDMIVLCGPFTQMDCDSPEDLVVAQAKIADVIAQLENVVCRVCYLASNREPTKVVRDQLHLTPKSVNIHNRALPLANGFFVAGFAETEGNLVPVASEDKGPAAALAGGEDSDGEVEGLGVETTNSTQIIDEMLNKMCNPANIYAVPVAGEDNNQIAETVFAAGGAPKSSKADEGDFDEELLKMQHLGIFALNYKFSHTLNHFLFHTPEKLAAAGVKLAIIAQPVDLPNPVNLPAKLGALNIVNPGSLRVNGDYSVVTINWSEGNGAWEIKSNEKYKLNINDFA